MSSPTRKTFLCTIAASMASLACTPALASATTYCVHEPACVGVKEAGEGAGLQNALSEASTHTDSGGADIVEIGAGTYTHTGGFVYNGDAVVIRGAGRGSTILTDDGGSGGEKVLSVTAGMNPVASLEELTVRIPKKESQDGLELVGSVAERVAIEGGGFESGNPAAGAQLFADALFANGSIEMTEGESTEAATGYESEIRDSTLVGSYGVQMLGPMTVRGCEIFAGTGVDFYRAEATIENTLIDLRGSSGYGVELGALKGSPASATLRGLTIVNGSAGSVGIREESYSPESKATVAHVDLEDSIISGVAHPIVESTEEADASATATSSYSSFDPSGDEVEEVKGGAKPTLSILDPASTTPDFVAPVLGPKSLSEADWRLAPGSPLIDAGTPGALASGESSTDAAGLPRLVHGRRDVGAFEYQWRAPTVTATASTSSIAPGSVVSFSGSASVLEPGDSLAGYQWSFDDGASVPAGPSAQHAFTTVGAHTATFTATDLLGVHGNASVTVDVISPINKAPAPAPLFSGLRISPSSFKAARSGGSIGRGHQGTKVSYSAASGLHVMFTLQRVTGGVKSGRSCLAPKKGRHGKPCSRLVSLHGSFARVSANGANSFRFTGRLAGHTLKPGRYELVASWPAAGKSKRASAAFRIL